MAGMGQGNNPSRDALGSDTNYQLKKRSAQERYLIMSRRNLISLAASVIIGVGCIATVATDAFAYRGGARVGRAGVYHGGVHRAGVYRGGVYRGGVYRGAPIARGVAVGVGAAAVGAAAAGAYYAPRCGYYPYPPC